MQLIEVVPSGPLARFYPSLVIGASSVAEAIEGWSRQVSHRVIKTVMEVPGFATEEKLREKTEVTRIELWPAMFGGSGFGRILLGAAMIGLSFLPGIGQALQTALILGGIGNVVGGVMSLFMKAPSISKEEDPEASKYIGGGQNTTAIGTPIPIAGGRILIGGHTMSLQVNSNELVYGTFPSTTS